MLVIDSWESRGIVLAMSDGMFCAGMCWHHLGGVSSPLATRMVCCWCGAQASYDFVLFDPEARTPASQRFHGHFAPENVARATYQEKHEVLDASVPTVQSERAQAEPEVVRHVSRRMVAPEPEAAQRAVGTATIQSQRQELRARIPQAWKIGAPALPGLRSQGADAPRELRRATDGDVALPQMPSSASSDRELSPVVWRSIDLIPPPPPEPARCRHGKTGPCWDDPPLSIGVNQ